MVAAFVIGKTVLSPFPESAVLRLSLSLSHIESILGCQIKVELKLEFWHDVHAPCQPKSGGRVQAHIIVPGPFGDGALEALVSPLLPKQRWRMVLEPEVKIKAGSRKEKPQKNVAGN